QRSPVGSFGPSEIPIICDLDPAELCMTFCQVRLQLKGLFRSIPGPFKTFLHRDPVPAGLDRIGPAQFCPAESETGVKLKGVAEINDRPGGILPRRAVQEVSAEEHQPLCLGILCATASCPCYVGYDPPFGTRCGLFAEEPCSKLLYNRLGNVILNFEYVIHGPVIGFGPEMIT